MLRFLSFFALLCSCFLLTFAAPSPPSKRGPIAGGADLRILPFGDSITWGQSSSKGNGWRLTLLEKLIGGNRVEYVGKLKHGTMTNNENEGHQGYDIELIREKGMPDFSQRPNVILLMLGTNNIVRDVHYEQAPQLLSDLIDFTIQACPDAALLVATIPPLRKPEFEVKRIAFNEQVPGIVRSFADKGKHVALADMSSVKTEHINTFDNVHPTDEGYKIIGEKWYDAVVEAGTKGWIQQPVAKGTPSHETLSKPVGEVNGNSIGNLGNEAQLLDAHNRADLSFQFSHTGSGRNLLYCVAFLFILATCSKLYRRRAILAFRPLG